LGWRFAACSKGFVDKGAENGQERGFDLALGHVVDGAPAARFTRRFKELIESGYGLDDIG
jgi:hypothetical protein